MELYILLFFVAIGAGVLNALAGGGTFFTFPVLILMGMNPIIANGTSKVGLWIGSIGSLRGYWPEIKRARMYLPFVLSITFVGSALGTCLLLVISAEQFSAMVPWLLLFATLSFTFGGYIREKLHHIGKRKTRAGLVPGLMQGLIGVYAGFFGAGLGIYLLALYDWVGMKNIHMMNALKVSAAVMAHTVSAAILIVTGTLNWPVTLIIMGGAVIGGYGGSYLAKRLPRKGIRWFITIYGFAVSAYFFAQ